MTRRVGLLLFVLTASEMGFPAQPAAQSLSPLYAPVTLCGISFHHQKADPKYISVEAEFVNAMPHGAILLDHHCPGRGLQIDFPKTRLDPGAATLKQDFWRISRANGRFRGMLERDERTGRIYLSVQSVLNLQPEYFYPEERKPEPIQLPQPELPHWPPEL